MPGIKSYGKSLRYFLGILSVVIGLLLLSGAISIPFIFESQTIRYKFGLDRKLLVAGQAMGVVAGFLLLFQLILSARLKILDRIFSINRLIIQHRINGIIIGVLALLHVLLILVSLGTETLSLSLRQWPEFIGVLLILMILGSLFFSVLRQPIGLAYERWWFFHRVSTPLIVVVLGLHILFVSDTFKSGFPRNLVLGVITAYTMLYVWTRIRNLLVRRCIYRVENVSAAGEGSYSVELRPEKECRIGYNPGQFAFLRFKSDKIPGEEHPFTISSTPTRPSILQFTIRASGDWTKKIKDLDLTDLASIHGPFGLYGQLDLKTLKGMVMIAGGIGITPMLSILRYMSDMKDNRRVVLVWSNRTRKQVVYPDEFRDLEKGLPGLEIIHVFTREPEYEGEKGRLEKERLERLLSGCSRDSMVLVCGPPQMMVKVKRALMDLGFPRCSINMERFSL